MARTIDFQSDPQVIWEMYDGVFNGDLAFDVGANAGMVSLILAEHFSRVIAYEPHPDSFTALSELAPPVFPSNLALSDKAGKLELGEAKNASTMGEYVTGDSLAWSWGRPTGTATVEASTLDREAEEWGVPDFIKIDTEGHEVQVIKGGAGLFSAASPRLLIEVHAAQNGPKIESLLPDYDFVRIDHPGYAPDTYARANHFYLVSV